MRGFKTQFLFEFPQGVGGQVHTFLHSPLGKLPDFGATQSAAEPDQEGPIVEEHADVLAVFQRHRPGFVIFYDNSPGKARQNCYTGPMILLKLRLQSHHGGQPADRVLADLLALELGRKVGRAWARGLLLGRRVNFQGRPVGLERSGQPGQVWELRLSQEEARPELVAPATLPFDPRQAVVYRDQHWLALNKPAGLLVHPGVDKSQPDLVSAVSSWLEGLPWTLQHRLDRETSGLVLLTLSLEARVHVARQFEERQVEKGYLCRVGPLPKGHPQQWSETQPLLEQRGRVSCHPNGKPAETRFRVLSADGRQTLLEASPKTGRKHQIRVHLAARRLPIVGDRLYGGASGARLFLHAYWLYLDHLDGSRRRLEAPRPDF